MATPTLSFIIGIIGNLISILVFASPMKTFREIVKRKSTGDYKEVPYITTLMSTSLWTFYGLLKPDGLLVVTVNAAGAVFQFLYVSLFLVYATRDKRIRAVKWVAILNVGLLGAVIAVTLLALHGNRRLTFVGILCAGFTIGMYASPLSVMRMVVKTKSVEYMPFLLSFFLFLNGGVWSIYSLLVKDIYIGVPNGLGFFLGTIQLILYAMYYNHKSKSTKSTDEEKEVEGSAHLGKEIVEMRGIKGGYAHHHDHNHDHDDHRSLKSRNLNKGRSLPKPHVNRQNSFQKIIKTLSLSPYELKSTHGTDVESSGVDDDHHHHNV